MKSVIILLTLSIFHILFQEINSASPRLIDSSRGNYGGTATKTYKPPKKQGDYDEDDNRATFFPGNAMLLFQLKTAIQSSLHKIEDDKESLERIKLETFLLKGLSDALFSFLGLAVEGIMTECVYFDGPLPKPIKVGNKCYSISDVNPGGVADQTYADARQMCLAQGGDLANPYLLEGGTFGPDLEEAIEEAKEHNIIISGGTGNLYWMGGEAVVPNASNPTIFNIKTLNGFIVPNTLARFFGVANFPYTTPELILQGAGLAIVGPLTAIEHDWYITSFDKMEERPFVCEFPTVVNLGAFSIDFHEKFRTNKSPLIQNFLRKVNLIHKRKSEVSKPLIDVVHHSILEAASKEPQNAKITENAEYEKKIEATRFGQATKTDDAVNNTMTVEMPPAVVKKDKPLEPETDKPLEAKNNKPLVAKKDKPLETKIDKPLETKKILNTEEMKVVEEIPNRQGEITSNKEVVVEDDNHVNEKQILLEDILGKLEQLESFRELKP